MAESKARGPSHARRVSTTGSDGLPNKHVKLEGLLHLLKKVQRTPSRVLPDLFIGSRGEAIEHNLIETNIRYVLNVVSGSYDSPDGFTKKILPISDFGTTVLDEVLPECFTFIDEGHSRGFHVVVHCNGGINRSATVVLAYLVARRRLTLRDAWATLTAGHPRASPHELYWKQLRELELKQLGAVSLTAEDVGPTLQDLMRRGGRDAPLADPTDS